MGLKAMPRDYLWGLEARGKDVHNRSKRISINTWRTTVEFFCKKNIMTTLYIILTATLCLDLVFGPCYDSALPNTHPKLMARQCIVVT
jgi:hypothetical protein